MRLLLDTHILLALARNELEKNYPKQAALMQGDDVDNWGSSASLWEATIKVGIGKLDLGMPPSDFARYLEDLGIQWLAVTPAHATHLVEPEPPTRDPFDRMLLAQCAVEGLKLVTVDKLLTGHPLVLSL